MAWIASWRRFALSIVLLMPAFTVCLLIGGCAADKYLLAYPPLPASTVLKLSDLSRTTLTDDLLNSVVKRHAKLTPSAVRAEAEYAGEALPLEVTMTKHGLIRVCLDADLYERFWCGEVSVRIECVRERKRYSLVVGLSEILRDSQLSRELRALVANRRELLVWIGGWTPYSGLSRSPPFASIARQMPRAARR